jgi:hypothetical protein
LESKLMEIVGEVNKLHRFYSHNWGRAQLPLRQILLERERGLTGINYSFLRPGQGPNLSEDEIKQANVKQEREEVAGAEQGTGAAEATQDQPGQSGEDPEGEK